MIKKLAPLTLMLILSGVTHADTDDHERARVVFSADDDVVEEISYYHEKGFSRSAYAVPSLIHGQCGVIGCSKTFLVVQEMHNETINAQNAAVVRLVTIPATADRDEDIIVEPVDYERLRYFNIVPE